MTPLNLPAAFVPFTKFHIGENFAIGAQALVTFGGFAPLLIGDGPTPRVWLSVPPDAPGGPWRELIVDNASAQTDLVVKVHPGFLKHAGGCRTSSSQARRWPQDRQRQGHCRAQFSQARATDDQCMLQFAHYPANARCLALQMVRQTVSAPPFGLTERLLDQLCHEFDAFTGVLKSEPDLQAFPKLLKFLQTTEIKGYDGPGSTDGRLWALALLPIRARF